MSMETQTQRKTGRRGESGPPETQPGFAKSMPNCTTAIPVCHAQPEDPRMLDPIRNNCRPRSCCRTSGLWFSNRIGVDGSMVLFTARVVGVVMVASPATLEASWIWGCSQCVKHASSAVFFEHTSTSTKGTTDAPTPCPRKLLTKRIFYLTYAIYSLLRKCI
jgi:hypothetical protein